MKTTPTAEIRARDEFLCFCMEITDGDFQQSVARDPKATFDQICSETGLGTKCTACLLNAETAFVEARTSGHGPSADTRGQRQVRRGARLSRQAIYSVLDRLAPQFARRVPGIIPVFAGKDIRTILSIANSIPPVIGSRSPDFHVEVACRDEAGHVYLRHKDRVLTGSRMDFDISQGLTANDVNRDGDRAIVTGSCWLSYRAASPGYLGSIRPHFTVETPVASGSVHSAGQGRRSMFWTTIASHVDETQYVSAVNCTRQNAHIEFELAGASIDTHRHTVALPPYASLLYSLPFDALPSSARGASLQVVARADCEVRWHFVVAAGDPPRIAVDHA